MSRLLRVIAILALGWLAWPELARYRAERDLAQARDRLEHILQGDAVAARDLDRVIEATRVPASPADARAPLMHGVALLLAGRAPQARETFERAIALGERPELVLNLGRARAALGDERGARIAFLRSAWAAPASIATLPTALRSELQAEVARLEAELRAGRLAAPPPLQ